MPVIGPFNEGKACDAVIQRLEAQFGCCRQDVRYPERENHSAPVEIVCTVGGQLFAFEHTGIEPYEGHIKGQAQDWKEFSYFRDKVKNLLPDDEHVFLYVPARCLANWNASDSKRIQRTLFEFVASQIDTLPARPFGSYHVPDEFEIPEIPFKFSIRKSNYFQIPGAVSLIQVVDGSLEYNRTQRIRRAYERKSPKLYNWSRHGARSILILEENDIALTNPHAVAISLREIENGKSFRPDEIYLLTSKADDPWFLWALRIDNSEYAPLAEQGLSMTEVDPRTLTDITKR